MKTLATTIMYVFFTVQLGYVPMAYAEYPQVSDFEEISTEEIFTIIESMDWEELISVTESMDWEEYFAMLNSVDWEQLIESGGEIDPNLYEAICYPMALAAIGLLIVGFIFSPDPMFGGLYLFISWVVALVMALPAYIFCFVI